MKKIKLIALAFIVIGTIAACKKEAKPISVKLKSSETYSFSTNILGKEEGASIKVQASHYERSEIIRDSSTNGEAVYYYKAANGFVGNDQVLLEMQSCPVGAANRRWTQQICFELVP